MKIINNGLPEVIYDYLCQDFYDTEAAEGSISATTLKKPIQEMMLVKRYFDKIEVDATDRIWSLFGQGIHAVLERQENGQQEERLFAEVLGRRISGKYDLIKNGRVHDYKCTSAWTRVWGSRDDDWKFQLSVYKWLYWMNEGIELENTGSIIAIYRDWSEKKYKDGGEYPELPIEEISIELYPLKEIEEIIKKQVRKIIKFENVNDEELPKCTKDERWWNEKQQRFIKCERYCLARQFCCQAKGEENGK